jgi:hypothetical protein
MLAAFTIAAGCFLTTLTGWPGALVAGLVFLLGCFVAWDRALLGGPQSPSAIEFRGTGEAMVLLKSGGIASLTPVAGVGVTRHWVALGARHPSRRGLLVVAGMLGEDAFRCLRIWAIWGKVPGVALRQLPG